MMGMGYTPQSMASRLGESVRDVRAVMIRARKSKSKAKRVWKTGDPPSAESLLVAARSDLRAGLDPTIIGKVYGLSELKVSGLLKDLSRRKNRASANKKIG
jgi:hypothetical protein